jgi:hypothetical protein
MPIPTYYKDIIEAIQTATDEGRVKWNREEGDFAVMKPEARVHLSSGIDAFRHTRFVVFSLRDRINKARDNWSVNEGDEDYETMYRLVMSARLAATGVQPQLEEIRQIFLHSPSIGEDSNPEKKPTERYGT